MEDYRLDQSGQEVQDILNGAAMQTDLTAETERAQLAEQTIDGKIDGEETRAKAAEKQNADDIDAIEEKIPSSASSANKLATQSDVSDEEQARQQADQALQGNIDAEELRAKAAEKQNADDIDAIEEKIPSGASSSDKLATESYVNDKVATDSATFRGTFNLVSDLGLVPSATHSQIAAALLTAIATADNNDYAFVQVPTSVETPTQIAKIERYKFDGSAWAFEYELNNSGFTAAQWAAINSGITSGDVSKLATLPTSSELTTLLNGKQDALTFDNVPTQGSNNPVKSGGVYSAIDEEKGARRNSDEAIEQSIAGIAAKIPDGASSSNKMATESEITTLSSAIEAILTLIPSAATALNQLADKAFVNSSIATASATFRGTYNLVSDLHLALDATHAQIGAALLNAVPTADNNDYAFVQVPTSAGTPTEIRVTERYKFNGDSWSYEYDLNNSGFTASQWEAINSAITSALVAKLSALPTAAELTTLFAGKQNVLTFDDAPVNGSNNPVKSGGLYDLFAAIDAKFPSDASSSNMLVAENRLASYVAGIIGAIDASFDLTSADGHVTFKMTQADGVITSVQILTSDIASAQALTTLSGQVSTNASDIAALQDLYNALQQSAPEIIQPTDTWPVANPSDTVIYRVIDRENTPPEYYSDYMWNGTTMVLMATYNNAIDPRPKKGSANLVTSGGVFDNMGALDVSELNATGGTLATYADLSAALAAIPSDYQKGGMSIKFVQSTDHKYVQYRLVSDTFSTTPSDWQGVDDKLTAGSGDLVKSGVVFNAINKVVVESPKTSATNASLLTGLTIKSGEVLKLIVNCKGTFERMFLYFNGNTSSRLIDSATAGDFTNQVLTFIARYDITQLGLYIEGTVEAFITILPGYEFNDRMNALFDSKNLLFNKEVVCIDGYSYQIAPEVNANYCYFIIPVTQGHTYNIYPSARFISKSGVNIINNTGGPYAFTPDFTGNLYVTYNKNQQRFIFTEESNTDTLVGYDEVAKVKVLPEIKDGRGCTKLAISQTGVRDAIADYLFGAKNLISTAEFVDDYFYNTAPVASPDTYCYFKLALEANVEYYISTGCRFISKEGENVVNSLTNSYTVFKPTTSTDYYITFSKLVGVNGFFVGKKSDFKSPDILFGKKWVSCGDSFTIGAFDLAEGAYQFADMPYQNQKMVYPYFIGRRCGMNIVNEAVAGSTMAYINGSRNEFSTPNGRYTQIPEDADYITLWFGINDSHQGVSIGTISDNVNTTFYGAWNIVMAYLLEHHPNAKIGIIITNGCDNTNYPVAIRNIAKKWGVSYLDINGDYKVPLMLRCNEKPDVDPSVLLDTLKKQAVCYDEEHPDDPSLNNWHPSVQAHEYQSTFIESWLRNL